MELQDRLREHMHSELASTTTTRDLGDVMQRGDSIRRRRQALFVATPVVAVAVGVLALMASGRLADDSRVAEVDRVAAAGAELSLTMGSLDWHTQPATLGFPQSMVADGGVMYALSTAPGARWQDFPNGNIPKAIYTSRDGVAWSATPLDSSISSIAAADSLLYAVGTAPGVDAGSVSVEVRISHDQGGTFETVTLPFEARQGALTTTEVVATPGGALAVASSRQSTDPVALLPPDALAGGQEPVVLEDGIAVFPPAVVETAYETCFGPEPERCDALVQSEATTYLTWDELGLDAEKVMFGEIVTNAAYWTGDGSSFEPVEYPFPDGYIDQVFSVDGHSVVTVSGFGETQLFASDDARHWERLAEGVDAGFVVALGRTNDGVVMVSQGNEGGVVVHRAPGLGGPWEDVPVDQLLADLGSGQAAVWLSSAAVGNDGVAISLVVDQPAETNPIRAFVDRIGGDQPAMAEEVPIESQGILLVSTDLTQWEAVSTSDLGGSVNTMYMTPDGTLVAHGTVIEGNGRVIRQQAIARP